MGMDGGSKQMRTGSGSALEPTEVKRSKASCMSIALRANVHPNDAAHVRASSWRPRVGGRALHGSDGI